MKKMVLAATVIAGLTLAAGAASAQPYGYSGGYGSDRGYNSYARDSDRDGIPDAREWNRDRDRDGRPDQYDRHDNRRDRYDRRSHNRRGHYRPAPRYGQSYGYGYVQPYTPYGGAYRRY